ncbi:MAG: TerB family tellurite resistance protein [Candidatus Devosia symbiotica]|nr:TerB family tellurite resistance protein [Candidatus Devosia symbiotica]
MTQVFNLAKQDVAGFDAYARKVIRFFADSPETLEYVLDGLFFIARADGVVHPDWLIARGVSEELIDVATVRMKLINLAYQALTKPIQQLLLSSV